MSTPTQAPRKGTELARAWLGSLRCRLCDAVWLAMRASPPVDYVPCPCCGEMAGVPDDLDANLSSLDPLGSAL